LAILTFALVFPAGAFAQNAIAVQNASGDPGDNGVIVRIELDNDTDVGGFQFILTDVTGDLTPQSVRAGTRLDGLFTLFDVIVIDGNTGIDSVRVVGINIESLKVLPALKGVIVEVLYNVAPGAAGGPYNL
ncbi:MAG TPA: hypothetical protein DIT99_24355, partial [Candidatus Latescibacteria bacterium]|nr:hypothetical protein [Candidatus Latescibacterota bacterium]